MNLDTYQKRRREWESLQREADRAAGELSVLLRELQGKFSCASLQEGEKLLVKLEKTAVRKEEQAEKACTEFEEKWKEKLDG